MRPRADWTRLSGGAWPWGGPAFAVSEGSPGPLLEPSDEQGLDLLVGGFRMLTTQLLPLDRLARREQVERQTQVFSGKVSGIVRHRRTF
jgi:hypothetical protein